MWYNGNVETMNFSAYLLKTIKQNEEKALDCRAPLNSDID